jgi:hypothetical protein
VVAEFLAKARKTHTNSDSLKAEKQVAKVHLRVRGIQRLYQGAARWEQEREKPTQKSGLFWMTPTGFEPVSPA